jgi:hypothetical protein
MVSPDSSGPCGIAITLTVQRLWRPSPAYCRRGCVLSHPIRSFEVNPSYSVNCRSLRGGFGDSFFLLGEGPLAEREGGRPASHTGFRRASSGGDDSRDRCRAATKRSSRLAGYSEFLSCGECLAGQRSCCCHRRCVNTQYLASMKKSTVTILALGSFALGCVAVVGVVIGHFVEAANNPPPYEHVPDISYHSLIAKTLAAFDSGKPSEFDSLYPHNSVKFSDEVWDACSIISPHGRKVDWPVASDIIGSGSVVGVPISGVSKSNPTEQLSCAFDLDSTYTNWWEIYPLVLRSSSPSPEPLSSQQP